MGSIALKQQNVAPKGVTITKKTWHSGTLRLDLSSGSRAEFTVEPDDEGGDHPVLRLGGGRRLREGTPGRGQDEGGQELDSHERRGRGRDRLSSGVGPGGD